MKQVWRQRTEGFTFMETLVSIAILAILLAAAAPIAQATIRTLSTTTRDSARLFGIARAYDQFQALCEETFIPPWVDGDIAIAPVSGGFRVAYLRGTELEAWQISTQKGELRIETPQGGFIVQAEGARVERIDIAGRAIGLYARFEILGRTWTWKGYLGASGY
jgi:prepilin-type N-terminal cleavage/methylation domain-containing protein